MRSDHPFEPGASLAVLVSAGATALTLAASACMFVEPLRHPSSRLGTAALAVVATGVTLAGVRERARAAWVFTSILPAIVVASATLSSDAWLPASRMMGATAAAVLLLGPIFAGFVRYREARARDALPRLLLATGPWLGVVGAVSAWYAGTPALLGVSLGVSAAGAVLAALAAVGYVARLGWLGRVQRGLAPGWRIAERGAARELAPDGAELPAFWTTRDPARLDGVLVRAGDHAPQPFRGAGLAHGAAWIAVGAREASRPGRRGLVWALVALGATGGAVTLARTEPAPVLAPRALVAEHPRLAPFDGYTIDGVSLWRAPREEQTWQPAPVIGYDQPSRRVLRGAELFARADGVPVDGLVRYALDVLDGLLGGELLAPGQEPSSMTWKPIAPPSIDDGVLTFWIRRAPLVQLVTRVDVDLRTGRETHRDEPKKRVMARPTAAVAPSPDDPREGRWTLDDATAGLPPGRRLTAVIDTGMGAITCALYPERAPLTVASFVGLARGIRPWKTPKGAWVTRPAYDGTPFHRVIKDFMIQGGDARGNGTGEAGFLTPDEIWQDGLHDHAGQLCAANRGPDTNSAQFFITDAPAPHLDEKYTIFGECDALDRIHAIASAEVHGEKPERPVRIERITIRRE